MTELPRGWIGIKVGEVVEIKLGKMLDSAKNKGVPRAYLRNINVRWGSFNLNDILEMRFTEDEFEAFGIKRGDLIVCEGGEPGRCAVWQGLESGLQFQKALMRLRPLAGVSPFFMQSALRRLSLSGELDRHFTGTTIKHLPQSSLAAVPIPLPPLAEQKRIVAKLDTLSAKSDRARTELARIETLISRYKQAILDFEFNDESASPDTQFGDHVMQASNGLSKREGKEGEWTKVLRLADLNGGLFRPSDPRSIMLTSNEIEKYRIADGDLIVIRVNGSSNLVGRAFRFEDTSVWAFCDHFIRLRLKPSLHPTFAALYLNSPLIRGIIEQKFVSTSGQKTISQKTLEELPVPSIKLERQIEIVRRIEATFACIDRLATEAKRASTLVGKLDEAILAKAFRGELVPQDENDEPASVLLERIRADRAAAPKPKRGRART